MSVLLYLLLLPENRRRDKASASFRRRESMCSLIFVRGALSHWISAGSLDSDAQLLAAVFGALPSVSDKHVQAKL